MSKRKIIVPGVTVSPYLSIAMRHRPEDFQPVSGSEESNERTDEGLLSSFYVSLPDSYKPKVRLINLVENRRYHAFEGRHEWRRNYHAADDKYKHSRSAAIEHKKLLSHQRRHVAKLFSESGINDYSDEPLDYELEPKDVNGKDTAKILKSYGLNPRILEEYSLEDAIKIQARIVKEGLNLPDMAELGRFVIEERTGDLYFIDHKVEAFFGGDRKLTAEEFFNAEKVYEFQHFRLPHGAFTYVTWISGRMPELKGQTKKEYRVPLENRLNGSYRDDPNDSGHRIEHLLNQHDKVRETDKPN